MNRNPDLIAEIRPALREFEEAISAGDDSLCLTLEVDGNSAVWVQLMGDSVNMGLLEEESSDHILGHLKTHRLEFSEEDYQPGLAFTVELVSKRDERFVLFLHDVLCRHQDGGNCCLNVKYENL